MAGGKGGSQTTTQEVPEWQKKEIMEAIQKAKAMNIPYAPYTGIDVVAPAQGLNDNLNLGLGAFGMSPMQSVLPEAVSEGGLRGYRSYDMYQDNLDKFKEMYPDIYRRIDSLVNEPSNTMSASPGAVGTINPVTGMPIVPETTASVPGYEERENNEQFEKTLRDIGYYDPKPLLDNLFGPKVTPYDELPGISQNPATGKIRL